MTSKMMALCVLASAGVFSGLNPGTVSAQKRQRDLITREELAVVAEDRQDLWSAIKSLRPHFLEPPRGVRTMGGAEPPAPTALYVDGTRQGELTGLRMIQTSEAGEVRYLDPAKAQAEFGISHSGGAVMVRLFKPLRPSQPPPPS